MYQLLKTLVPVIPVTSLNFEKVSARPNHAKHVTGFGVQEGDFAISGLTNSLITKIHD